MKAKLIALGEALIAKAPLIAGLCIGYLAHPLIKAGIDIVSGLIHMILG